MQVEECVPLLHGFLQGLASPRDLLPVCLDAHLIAVPVSPIRYVFVLGLHNIMLPFPKNWLVSGKKVCSLPSPYEVVKERQPRFLLLYCPEIFFLSIGNFPDLAFDYGIIESRNQYVRRNLYATIYFER